MPEIILSHVEELERKLLRAICSSRIPAAMRQGLIGELANYSWRHHEHRIVFNGVLRLRGRELEDVRAALPAVTTRMGFPDVNWDEFFVDESADEGNPLALARTLLAGAPREP
jgi:hypothetical protein